MHQTPDTGQQTADSRQQTADSRQQTADTRHHSGAGSMHNDNYQVSSNSKGGHCSATNTFQYFANAAPRKKSSQAP